MPIGLKRWGGLRSWHNEKVVRLCADAGGPRPPRSFVKPAAKRSASGHPPRARVRFYQSNRGSGALFFFPGDSVVSSPSCNVSRSRRSLGNRTRVVPSLTVFVRLVVRVRGYFFLFRLSPREFLRRRRRRLDRIHFSLVLNARHVCIRIRDPKTVNKF